MVDLQKIIVRIIFFLTAWAGFMAAIYYSHDLYQLSIAAGGLGLLLFVTETKNEN